MFWKSDLNNKLKPTMASSKSNSKMSNSRTLFIKKQIDFSPYFQSFLGKFAKTMMEIDRIWSERFSTDENFTRFWFKTQKTVQIFEEILQELPSPNHVAGFWGFLAPNSSSTAWSASGLLNTQSDFLNFHSNSNIKDFLGNKT